MRRLLVIGLAFLLVSAQICAVDWLQWGGPNGDYSVDVKGLAEGWPEAGPPRLWKRPLGQGYPSILYKDARLYTMYRDPESGEEVVVALDADTGATVWEHRYTVEIWYDMIRDFGLGPNATPLGHLRRLRPKVKRFAEAVADELIPMIEERFRTLPGGENRLMTGIASGSFASARTAHDRRAGAGCLPSLPNDHDRAAGSGPETGADSPGRVGVPYPSQPCHLGRRSLDGRGRASGSGR